MPIKFRRSESAKSEHATLAEIREGILAAARDAKENGRHDTVTVTLNDTAYTLSEPFVLSLDENPELASVDITFRAKYPGQTKISSLVRMHSPSFVRAEGKPYFTFTFDKDNIPLFRELFLNFKGIGVAKSPSWKNPEELTKKGAEVHSRGFRVPIELARRLAEEPIGATELMMHYEWEFASLHVVGVDLDDVKEYNGEAYAMALIDPREMNFFCEKRPTSDWLKSEGREIFFRNAPAFLSEKEDTFAYDYHTGVLYLNPHDKVYMPYHAVEYPTLDTLFHIKGLENVRFEGIRFSGATSTYASKHVYYAYQANHVRFVDGTPHDKLRAAAVLLEHTRAVTFDGCVFDDLGTNGIEALGVLYGITVKNCEFKNVEMSALALGTPGGSWAEDRRAYNLHIENNRFTHIGYEYPSAPCIYIAQVDGLKILHNTIRDTSYSAISVGWCWDPADFELGERVNIRDAEIAYNRIEDFMQLLHDGGAVYVLGGNANHKTTAQRFNTMHDNYACAANIPYYTGKYGYYCDGASSHWEVSHSVMLNVPLLPIYSQPHPLALSYHNHFIDIYSNYPAHTSTSVEERDIVTVDYHLLEGDANALLDAFPEAKAIRDAAGCDLPA